MFTAKIEYSNEALEPFLSSETLQFHHGKHHVGYANTLNGLIKGTEFEESSLEDIILKSRGTSPKIFNNAAQIFNHDFYWKCLSKDQENNTPSDEFKSLITEQFGSFQKFLEEYALFAGTMFGSGWSWIVSEPSQSKIPHLKFINTSNAENPLGSGDTPVCVIDLWEHAYYIDYRNNRAGYIEKIVNNCINWNFCEKQLEISTRK